MNARRHVALIALPVIATQYGASPPSRGRRSNAATTNPSWKPHAVPHAILDRLVNLAGRRAVDSDVSGGRGVQGHAGVSFGEFLTADQAP